MIQQTIIYLLVFASMVCFGYKKFSKYAEFQLMTTGGAVFQLAPDEQFKVKGVVGDQKIMFDISMKIRDDDQTKEVKGRMVCVGFPQHSPTSQPYNRLIIRVLAHGYGAEDPTELDEFVVTECDQGNLENMFDVTRFETNKYTLTFKDTSGQCFKRDLEVIEGELTLTVRRQEPVKQDCPESNEFLKTQVGHVVPQSWNDNGDLRDVYYEDPPHSLGSKFKMQGSLADELEESTFLSHRHINLDGQKFTVVNVFYKAIPIDRLFAKTASEFLDRSINQGSPKNGFREFYVDYLDTSNICLRRKYEINVQRVNGDDHLRRVTVKRMTPVEAKCRLQKFNAATYRMRHDVRNL